jgi:hypothetical protein
VVAEALPEPGEQTKDKDKHDEKGLVRSGERFQFHEDPKCLSGWE